MLAAFGPLLLFLAAETPPVAAAPSAAPAPAPMPALAPTPTAGQRPAPTSGDLFDNAAIPAMQVVAAEAVMALALWGIDATRSDTLSTALLLSTAPAVTLSTCGLGALSRHHRGHCWHALLGGALGAASGLLVYGLLEGVPSLNPLEKGSDDTQTFMNEVAAAIWVAAIGLPLGTVIAWNAGKDLLPDDATPAPPPRSALPPLPRTAGTPGPPALILPLLATTF